MGLGFEYLFDGIIKGLFSVLLQPSSIFIFIILILLKIYYPKLRGYMGEFWVKKDLSKLSKKDYIILNDIMIEDEKGTHQIDHLIISKFGIFVIEMKNYYGIIVGDDYKDKWTQILGKNKYYFKNPIHQNYGHEKALEKILNIDRSFLIPIICFSNSAKLRVKSKSIIVQLDNLTKTIEGFNIPLLDVEINTVSNIIIEKNIVDRDKRKKHVKVIKNKMIEENKKIDNMICPKCGGQLILRKGKYGTFTGCSNFPNCRYIKK